MAQPGFVKSNNKMYVFEDSDALAAAAAQNVVQKLGEAIQARGRATIALSGGSTPEKMYGLLASPPHSLAIDWSMVYILVGDERFVPYEDPRSNFGMIRRTLLQGLDIKADHLFPIPADVPSPAIAALTYEGTLKQIIPDGRIDVVLLGLGEDGHTASLFPHHPSLNEKDRWVVPTPAGTLPPAVDRITLTYPLLNLARLEMFLVSGEKKREVLRIILSGSADSSQYPAAGIKPIDGEVWWLVDRSAAGDST